MPNKRKIAAISIKESKKREIMNTPDTNTFFKIILDLDNEKTKIITIPFSLIKEKIKEKDAKR